MNIRHIIAAASLCALLTAPAAFGKKRTVSNDKGGSVTTTKTAENGAVNTSRTATSATGQSANSEKVQSWDSATKTRTTSKAVNGPNGGAATAGGSATYTNNGDGTVTREASATGFGGRTRSSVTTGNGQESSSTVQHRNGSTTAKTRKREKK